MAFQNAEVFPLQKENETMEYAYWCLCRALLQGLETIDWPESLKEMQRNWIGKSIGASVRFPVQGHEDVLEVFTTRPDTLFGVTFMTLAPELDLVQKITTPDQKASVDAYIESTAQRSERDRMADVKTISGVFTGAYAVHPLTQEPIPIWIGDYVLAGYGTGAVMAVPCGISGTMISQSILTFLLKISLPILIFLKQPMQKKAGSKITRF